MDAVVILVVGVLSMLDFCYSEGKLLKSCGLVYFVGKYDLMEVLQVKMFFVFHYYFSFFLTSNLQIISHGSL